MNIENKEALLLLSGGFDSPIAGIFAKNYYKRVASIHFNHAPFTDESALIKSAAIAYKLGFLPLHVLPFKYVLQELANKTERKLYFVLAKRFMLRLAEKLAEKYGYGSIITGESLAQVSSQTLKALKVISNAVKINVERPLIALSKQEIIDESIKHNLFEISKGKELCDPLAVRKPITKPSLEEVVKEERKIDIEKIIEITLKEEVILGKKEIEEKYLNKVKYLDF